MNLHLLRKFPVQILLGAQSLGVDVSLDQKTLSCEDAKTLEKKTGRSIGELAILGIEAAATPDQRERERDLLRSTIELMAAFKSVEHSKSRPSAAQQTRLGA
jgi:hypothetical protein